MASAEMKIELLTLQDAWYIKDDKKFFCVMWGHYGYYDTEAEAQDAARRLCCRVRFLRNVMVSRSMVD